jgi:predicted exporter
MDKGDKADNKKNTPLSSLKAIGIILALAAVFIFGPMLFISAVGKIEGFGSVIQGIFEKETRSN